MFKKTFVVLFFQRDRILILHLSSSKKKAERYGEVTLPSGLIENYKVIDVDKLAKVLKGAWGKLSIKEKSVGIIIPEFSTFTKLISLPSLSLSELNEAIRWQAQEFLPKNLSESQLDWRIVEKEKGKLSVLTVSVDNDTLMGYVTSCERAGLFPLVVETPSVCLSRLAQESEGGKLLLYKNFSETVLVLLDKAKIVGTSVLGKDEAEIVKTVSRMSSHYKDIKIDHLLLGGAEISENLVQKLMLALKVKPERLTSKVSGMNEGEIQKYLIPLSLAQTEAATPSDPSSLNLLPGELVGKYKYQRTKTQVWGLTLTITLFVWISFLVTLGAYLFMVQQINYLKTKNFSQDEAGRQKVILANEAKAINSVVNKVNGIKSSQVNIQTILNVIYKAKPSGVILNSYQVDLDKGEILVFGNVATRGELLTFKTQLEQERDFTSVSIPLSNFEKEVDIDFSVQIVWQK